LPKDILKKTNKYSFIWPENIHIRSYNPTTKGHQGQIKKALRTLLKAKKPVIYAGGGIISSNSSEELRTFAEKINCPVTTSLMGLGAFPGTHIQSISMLGMHGTYEANMAMHYSDVIFAIGVRFDDRTTNNLKKYCPNATILHVDIDPTSISKTVSADIPIVGDAKQVLKEMIELIKKEKKIHSLKEWWSSIEEWKKIKSLEYNKKSTKIKPQTIIKTLFKLTKGTSYITSDVGQHQMFTALYYQFNKPRRWINSGGLGTMGFGLPAALGVKLALPKATVICITGDGSIQMNIQELSTARQYNLAILILNLNNSSLGMVKQWQDMIYSGRHSHSYMDSLPDFVKLVESYGHIGLRVKKTEELEEKLMLALKKLSEGNLVFLDIQIDDSEHVYPMQIQGGGMNEMWLRKKEVS